MQHLPQARRQVGQDKVDASELAPQQHVGHAEGADEGEDIATELVGALHRQAEGLARHDVPGDQQGEQQQADPADEGQGGSQPVDQGQGRAHRAGTAMPRAAPTDSFQTLVQPG